MTEQPVDLDKHRGMAAQRATEQRRAQADGETILRELREREADLEQRMIATPATSWSEVALKTRHLLNLYSASLPAEDTRHRALVAAVFEDLARLDRESSGE